MDLSCLTEAGGCWLDQPISTFWGKGIGAAQVRVIGKQREAGIHEHADRSILMSGFGGRRVCAWRQQPRWWCAFWFLMAFCSRCDVAWKHGICHSLSSGERVKMTEWMINVEQCLLQKGKEDWMKLPGVPDWFGCLCIVFPWCCHLGKMRFWFWICTRVRQPSIDKIFWKQL